MEQLTVGQQLWKKGYRKSSEISSRKTYIKNFKDLFTILRLQKMKRFFRDFGPFRLLIKYSRTWKWLETFQGIKSDLLFIKNYLFRQLK